MKYSIIIFLSLFIAIFTSCCSDENHSISEITIDNFNKSDVVYIKHAQCSAILNSTMFGEILDVSCNGNNCFILDNNNTISCMDLSNNNILIQKKAQGHSKGELIMPTCITSDTNYLYIYDSGNRSINIYDYSLNFIKKQEFGFYPNEIMKCEQGFLCYSRFKKTVSIIGNDLELINSQQISNINVDISFKNKVFKKDCQGKIYCKGEYSDTIHILEKNKLIPLWRIHYRNNSNVNSFDSATDLLKSSQKCTLDYFPIEKGLIISFLDNNTVRFVQYRDDECNIISADQKPFIPKWQSGNLLFGFELGESLKGIIKFDNSKDSCNKMYCLKYKLL